MVHSASSKALSGAKKRARGKAVPKAPQSARRPRRPSVENSSPPPPPTLRVWLETKRCMADHLTHRVELEQIERAARVLLEGDSGREADPIVVEAVATILERVADHACALEFGVSADERVAAAEVLESVQTMLVKLAEPRRAHFVELVVDYARRLHALPSVADADEAAAIPQAFVLSAMRFDRAFRRLDVEYVKRQLLQLKPARRKSSATTTAPEIAGAMSAKVGAFNDRLPKRASAAFDKAWQTSSRERGTKQKRPQRSRA